MVVVPPPHRLISPAVATVDTNGKVTGVKAGTATITAASEADAAKTAELKVTVTEVKADDAYGYVMVHFIENNKGYAEKIYLDISRGDARLRLIIDSWTTQP